MSVISHVFPGTNSAGGYCSRFDGALRGMERIYILKGGPGCGKSTLLHRVAQELVQRDYDVELWGCASDVSSLDGVCAPQLSLAVLDGTAPHTVEPRLPGAVEQLIDLGSCWDAALLRPRRAEIAAVQELSAQCYARCTALLDQAADLLCSSAAQEPLPQERLRQTADRLTELIGDMSALPVGEQRELFAAAVTPAGLVDRSGELSRSTLRRICLTGGGAEERARLLGGVAEQLRRCRSQAVFYLHPLLPQRIVLITLPAFGLSLVSSAGEPQLRPGDRLLRLSDSDAGEAAVSARVGLLCDEAGAEIRAAKRHHDGLEAIYRPAMDFAAAERLGSGLLREIAALAGEGLS